jgi:DNA-binding MarR family transcriptional regulator
MSPTVTDDDAETAARLRLLIARLARQLRQAGPGDLTLSQWSALATIEQHGPLRIGDLAERERVSAPTATRLVAALAEQGLLVRTGDPADRRSAYVELSASGTEKLEWARSARTARLAAQISSLPAGEADRLRALLPLLERLLVDEDSQAAATQRVESTSR